MSSTESAEQPSNASTVRVRAAKPDPYQGLKGLDYIKARNLDRQVQRVQTSAQHTKTVREACK